MAAPLVDPAADLSDVPYFPLLRARLFCSIFHAQASDSEWRAGVTLWVKSWDQHPSGSLPNNDPELCRLAELGRDYRKWRKLKPMALHGWELADDGRLYHRVVAEVVNYAWENKLSRQLRTSAAREARLLQTSKTSVTDSVTDSVTVPPLHPPRILNNLPRESLKPRPRVTRPRTRAAPEGRDEKINGCALDDIGVGSQEPLTEERSSGVVADISVGDSSPAAERSSTNGHFRPVVMEAVAPARRGRRNSPSRDRLMMQVARWLPPDAVGDFWTEMMGPNAQAVLDKSVAAMRASGWEDRG